MESESNVVHKMPTTLLRAQCVERATAFRPTPELVTGEPLTVVRI